MDPNTTQISNDLAAPLADEAVMALLRKHSVVIDAEATEAKRRRRLQIGEDLDRARTDREIELARLEGIVQAAGQQFALLLPAHNRALSEVMQAQAAYEFVYANSDAKIQAIENSLHATSLPIDGFMRILIDLHERTRRAVPMTSETERQQFGSGRTRFLFRSDYPSIEKRLSAIVAAMRTVESWVTLADQSDLTQRFEALLDGVPAGENNFVEVVKWT